MDCIIPGTNMKVLAKALQALSKIGDELFIEAKTDGLAFITLNSSKTVCSRFTFQEAFFSSYEVNQNDSTEDISCKIHMKIFLPLFKGNLEKKLEYFKVEYLVDSDFIIFKMKYKCDDIVMVHKLRLMDTETLSIGVTTNSGCNNVSASSSFYNQLLSMFNLTDDEVTFEITKAKVVARNYCLGTPCRPKMMRTQINLNSTEFLTYFITKTSSINFSLKPFRTLVHFAETFNLNVDLNFEIGGKPLSMVLKNPTFEVSFIVATLDPYSDTNSSIATVSSPKIATKKPPKITDEADDLTSKESSFLELMKQSENVNDIDVIPKSPESPRSKKAKTVFGRCYDPTFHETVLGEVLAANSDSE
nr:PREDICTED: cell cycle checkpoint control protein RAD9A [Tribolium castaneum]|eukprot:XP_008194883.1 PREDICTED: cell cycle checkpoint control protein RAD9A [Tribolium castaneum]